MEDVRIRALTLRDTRRILKIDEAVTGVARPVGDNDLWRLIAETTTCFGAEAEGRLVGFVLADVRPWEFGNRAHVGWIIALGVEPRFQKHGLGRRLGERVLEEFRRLGVTQFKTLVESKDRGLLAYFRRLGFRAAREVVLEAGGRERPVPRRAGPRARGRASPRGRR